MSFFEHLYTDKITMERRKILVTGGTGLVGRAIQKVVLDNHGSSTEWFFAGSADADFRDCESTRAMFAAQRPTHVIHLAARVGGLFANMRYKVEFYRDNIAINDNVLEACREFHVKKVVSCLSTCIFPDKTTYPITEDMIHDGPPHPSNEGYAYAKRMIDVMNRAYHDEYGCNYTSIIPTNIYGPHDNFCLENSHVIPGLIHKCYVAKRDGKPFVISGTGRPLRQFIYSEDLARLIMWTLNEYDSVTPLILSVDEMDEISIGNVAIEIAKVMDFTGEIVFDTTKADGQYKKTAANTRLRGFLPDYCFKSIHDGIRDTVNWFLENYESARK